MLPSLKDILANDLPSYCSGYASNTAFPLPSPPLSYQASSPISSSSTLNTPSPILLTLTPPLIPTSKCRTSLPSPLEEAPRLCPLEQLAALASAAEPCRVTHPPPPSRGAAKRRVLTPKSRDYVCSEMNCNASFTRSEHLKRHALTHTQEKPYQCSEPECGRRFNRHDNLLTHQRRHRNNQRLSSLRSTPAPLAVTNINALLNNPQSTSAGYPVSSSSSSSSQDQDSSSVHDVQRGSTGKARKKTVSSRYRNKELKPFSCDECGKRFGRLEHVRRHKLVHTKERPFTCTICHKTFARSDNMLQHMRAHERKTDGGPVDAIHASVEAIKA
ncbi:hypothetical protein H4219_000347 [Mycoemilia scoparia]|uniref:C2H2-type domain-containing protein n=1 Tax=Mycoemilia scoparia TaxID=417184 RepID=A0A9W8DXI8_9FUNG|nr:hypothetical protein H4219_000347 [Mycoemilia scoparia]